MIIKLALLIASQIAPAPIAVPIQNPSFENAVNLTSQTACGMGEWGPIPGWTAKGPAFGVIAWTCEATPPDGKNVAFLAYGASMSQDLGITPQMGVYTLHFWVANWFYSYIGSYHAAITEGTKTVCETSGIATGDFTQITLICPVSGYIANNDKFWSSPGNLILSIDQKAAPDRGWPVLVDDVSLTFTPVN